MATAAQITANQANALRSTGPRTVQGKANSSRNHLPHGLSSKEFVILPGQQAEFDEFMAALLDSVKPVGAIELDLFQQLAHASWTLRRCRHAEVQLQETTSYPEWDPIIVPEFDKRLHSIDLYAKRAERTYHRALQQLKALQTEREFLKEAQAAAVEVCEETPLARRTTLSKHRQLLAQAHTARLEAEAIRKIESFVAPPIELSKPILAASARS